MRVKFPGVPGQGNFATAKKGKNVLIARPRMWAGKTGPRISTAGQCEIARRHDERAGFHLRYNTVTDRDQMLLRSPPYEYSEPRARAAPRDDRISVDLLLEMFPVQLKPSPSSSRYPENNRRGCVQKHLCREPGRLSAIVPGKFAWRPPVKVDSAIDQPYTAPRRPEPGVSDRRSANLTDVEILA